MSDLLKQLETIYHAKMLKAVPEIHQESFKKLYDRIIYNVEQSIINDISFNLDGVIQLYEISTSTDTFPCTESETKANDKNISRLEFIQCNKKIIEWYLTNQLNSPKHKFQITVESSIDNSFLYKKTKKTLYILLQKT